LIPGHPAKSPGIQFRKVSLKSRSTESDLKKVSEAIRSRTLTPHATAEPAVEGIAAPKFRQLVPDFRGAVRIPALQPFLKQGSDRPRKPQRNVRGELRSRGRRRL
jgi:hypothetical protein